MIRALVIGVLVSTAAWVLLPWPVAAVVEVSILAAILSNSEVL